MVSTKSTVQKVLDNLPDDCTMEQFLDRLRLVELIQQRLDLSEQPDVETVSQEEIERTVAGWLSRSHG